ncbi:protein of unknown function [endosymbiont DhMRE of Dentiscutata heterogama]|uniref:hypothetical protein n=1 Tax=endosymbiont DhMRE of Dentiscutata heterogama TaxID=1609546 RepID=UPI000629D2B6|nr:hypothetical protein [endosymbiont DhMRE of Dentiscutata heterogama]CFW92914.1 protein of unknown function [endosymbiont DhMRE of Dentiscutata heterogama]
MTTRITINVSEILVGNDAGGKTTITINAGHGNNGAGTQNRLESEDVRNEADGAVMGKLGNATSSIRTSAGGTDANTLVTSITGIKLTLPTATALKVARYIQWKGAIKDSRAASTGYWITFLNISYTDTGAERLTLNTNNLILDEKSFTGGDVTDWDRAKAVVEIDDVDITKASGANDFRTHKYDSGTANEKKVFEDLEELLTNTSNKYEDKTVSNLPDEAVITADLAKLTAYLSDGAGAASLANYVHTNAGDIKDDNAKKILRLIDNFQVAGKGTFGGATNTEAYYRKRIDRLIILLNEFKIWKEAGYNTIEEIVKANANGYVISNRGQNVNPGATGTQTLIGLAGQKGQIVEGYKIDNGPVLDGVGGYTTNANNIKYVKKFLSVAKAFGATIGGDQTTPANTNALDVRLNDKEFNASDPTDANGVKYTMKQIEAFLGDDWFGKNNIDNHNYGEMKADEYADVRKTRGFRLKDFLTDGRYFTTHGIAITDTFGAYDGTAASGTKDMHPTKLCIDLIPAPSADAAIDFAFFGKSYFKSGSKYTKNDDRYDGEIYKLHCNEVDGKDEKWHLNLYHGWLLESGHVGKDGSTYQGDANDDFGGAAWTGHGFTDTTPDGDTERANAKKAYDDVMKFLDVYTVNYTTSEKDKWEKNKKTLQEYIAKETSDPTSNEGKIGKYWKTRINEKITKNDAIFNPQQKKFDRTDELDKLIKAIKDDNDNKKKVYNAFKALPDTDAKKTNAVFDALKTLLGKLGDTIDKPSELEALATGSDKKTAWDMVNDNTKDNSGKGWAERTLTKAKTDLATAIATTKKAMENEGDAVTKTDIDNVDSIQLAKDIKVVFEKCKEAHKASGLTTSQWDTLKSEITALKPKTAAWNKVEAYKINDKGYASEALRLAEENSKSGVESFEDAVNNSTSVEEVRTKMKGKADSDIKRAQMAWKLKNLTGSDKTTETDRLLQIVNRKSTSTYKDNDENDYNQINKDIEELEKYINASDSDVKGVARAKIASLDSEFGDVKKNLKAWLAELKNRQTTLKSQHQKREESNGNKNPEKPWYKKPGYIILVGVVAVAVLGAIAYAIKANSRTEGEGDE